nr:MAG TPA: putative transglutaminase-family protein [Caudoviricetes sp.]
MSAVKIYKDGKFIPFNLSNLVEVPIGTVDYVAYTELDANQLILDGSLVSRELYKDLWEWVQTKPSMLLTEEEWQSALTANEGLACNCYSTGDGSTTFRLPKESVIILPNPIYFDASRSVGTEHTGSEVKPKTITKLPVVYAFGSVYNSGGIDISDIMGTVNDLVATKHIKTFNDLSQIGITKGTETLKAVGKALPDNSMLIYSIYPESGHNNVEYPYVSGQFRLIKSKNHCSLYFQTDFGRSYEKYFDDRDIYYVENSWKKIADKDKLSVPSNTKIAISLTNQGDSYTPSCDGLIWAKKSGTNSGSYMIISDTPEIKNSTFGQVLYDDYGGQYVYNIQGCCTVAKNQTMYFFWNYNAIVNFIPFKNENYTLYGEGYRIYIKVTDADGNILKDANVKILSSSGTQIVSGTTSGDGRFFIPAAKLQELFNYISYTIEVTYGSATESLIYMRNQIDKEAINDITISMSGITGGGGGNG